MTGGEKLGLPKDVDAAGDLVAQLRRRQQVEQRIETAHGEAEDCSSRRRTWSTSRSCRSALFSWLLAVFVLGCRGAGRLVAPAGDDARQIRRLDRAGRHRRLGLRLAVQILCRRLRPPTGSTPATAQLETCCDTARRRRGRTRTNSTASCRSPTARSHCACSTPSGTWPSWNACCRSKASAAKSAQEITAAERRLKLAEEKHAAALANWKAKLRALGPAGRRHPGEPGHDGRPMRAAGRARSTDRKPPRRHAPPPARVRRSSRNGSVALAEETGSRAREKAHAARAARSPARRVPPTAAARRRSGKESASGPKRSRSRQSSTPTPRSATAAAATRCSKNAASPTNRSCGNWPPSSTRPTSCARNGPPSRAKSPPPSASTAPRPISHRSWPPTRSAGWNTIGKRSPRNPKSSTAT